MNATKLSIFSGLKHFLILWSSQAVSALGSAMTSFALVIWAYGQQGTATSVSLLMVCSTLPSVLFSFIAGSFADRWNKKVIMLVSDSIAAAGSLTVLLLLTAGQLQVWHLYVVNLVIGLMNAFQIPASTVAVSLITPREQYTRIGGLQAFSGALVTILTPALATAVMAFGGIYTVLMVDLCSFVVAFLSLLFLVPIPKVGSAVKKAGVSTLRSCKEGFVYLKRHRSLLSMILFFSAVNLLASMAGNSIMPAMILSRTGNNQTVLGWVSASIGVGSILGSVLVTLIPPPRNRVRVIFLSCAVSFALCDLLWGVGRTAWVWIFAAVAGNLPLPFLNANLTTAMRTKIPLEMQGRVFSTRDTLQYCTIPLGYVLGGLLSDWVFEPFMAGSTQLKQFLTLLVGEGKGSGMAVIFLITGVLGCALSLWALRNPRYQIFNDDKPL